MTSSLNNNLSELDTLLQDLSNSRYAEKKCKYHTINLFKIIIETSMYINGVLKIKNLLKKTLLLYYLVYKYYYYRL